MSVLSKISTVGVVAILGCTLGVAALNAYTVVQDGEKKTQKFLGEITEQTFDAGLHIVNPFSSFEDWDIKEQMLVIDNITIPSQDKFTSEADITVKWSMGNANLPEIQRTVGVQSQVEANIIKKPLDAIIRGAGRDVALAQDLFTSTTIDKVQATILSDLREVAAPYGITIHEVYLSNITLPTVIKNAINVTKQLEEQKAQETARLEQQKLIYARQTAEAEAAALSADFNKKAAMHVSDAEAYAAKTKADSGLYKSKQEAAGNVALAKSVSSNLLELKDKEISLVKASRWAGGVPQTVMSSDSGVTSLYHMNK